ncbi:MupA/Atu3671 family FMN-dependent luciferase-like monooxygenase [Actinoalloteichus hymeniacidonis]|uniref:Natural product biosynthesis luciferase-like monooxygenase domain n=1 Tax=Actinoalloteichus hymeniacidonis TaxID=340345 RepID=A0AAC9HR41_9PSEU|nr:MupA/Atu3671 family FMN-dependent luciferase-like monooxygenase [Actinoalloteichus hymeniacidonis]AOS63788.1 natural product biosynthesis luciferase-like monooxygenase domain [Actinoalloteichus hymeniacidonis]MBB5908158.1 natural product biosynthesis luciferase-like monooxygenase protein [Actinoalloteichus hymeniacidonis]
MRFSLLFFATGDHAAEQYRLLLQAARAADEAGLEAVWMPERHFHPFGAPFPNPAVTAAAVAAVTSRVQIRAGSVVLPLHDPLRVVEEWSVVDQLSGGRVGLAFASGWNPTDFVLAPQNFADRRRILREQIDEFTALWASESVERAGPDGAATEVSTYPRPVRDRPPLWLTAAGSPATFGLAGELGAGVLTHLLGQSFDRLAENLADYGDAIERHGHGAGAERVALMLHTLVSDSEEHAHALAREPLTAYLRSSMDLFSVNRPGSPTADQLTEAELAELLDHTYRDFTADRCLIGSVDSCIPVVQRVAELGVDEIACLIDFGVGTDDVLSAIKSLTELQRRCADL